MKTEGKRNLLRQPDEIRLMTGGAQTEQETAPDAAAFRAGDVTVELAEADGSLAVFVQAQNTPVRELVLTWKAIFGGAGEVLGDTWERGYGDLEWKKEADHIGMPWYFFRHEAGKCLAFGVKVRPSAMCWWEKDGADVKLHLDVRCGTYGVKLGGRKLEAAKIVMTSYALEEADTPVEVFEACRAFCSEMCDDPDCRDTVIYGGNNWYYAYGKSSAKEILEDSAYLAEMTESIENRPFMVMDDGWQIDHSDSYNGGPWRVGNADYGDMGELAAQMRAKNVRPGIWFRPLYDHSADIPAEWRLERNAEVFDISVPEVLEHIAQDIRQLGDWGYELIKHDFSTYDIFGCWGFEMGTRLTNGSWRFHDHTKTTAELIVRFYEVVHEAAKREDRQDVLILGCNCIGHLGAGLMQGNRTGDDTSGVEWERTRKMGINTLAFRMLQQGTFYGADADCVGITEHIDWNKNRQWMEVLAESGTPFFVSVKPGFLNESQKKELKEAYRKASQPHPAAVPLVVPPFVDDNDEHGTDELRQSMRTGKYRDIFKTVNDEHCDRSARERCAEVGNNARRFFSGGKQEKRKGADQKSAERDNADCDHKLQGSLYGHLEISFRNNKSAAKMPAMEKSRKRSGPTTIRLTSVMPRPSRAGSLEFAFSHCSTKITRNSAVMAKSMPVESKGRKLPAAAPIQDPMIQ